MVKDNNYVIRGGDEGANRLRILGRVMWPTTEKLLGDSGLTRGMHCLDIGCGSGDVTIEIRKKVGEDGSVIGIDMDSRVLKQAKDHAIENEVIIEFKQMSISEIEFENKFDFIYARYILTHLREPLKALNSCWKALKTGGIIAIEDIDISQHVCYPPSPAFKSYIELYTNVVQKNGADPLIGPKLVGMTMDAGFGNINLNVVMPTFFHGEGKSIAYLTLKNIKDSIISAQLASSQDVDELLDQIKEFELNPKTLMSIAQTYQIWARK